MAELQIIPSRHDPLDDRALLRYSRHILLPEIGPEGQTRLLESSVLLVGAGGLGCAAGLYLGAGGVGRLTVADGDRVDFTNLQRQVAHDESRLGMNKARSLAETLLRINADITVETVESRLDEATLRDRAARCDAVVDASDNFATRHAINRVCVALRKPLVSGAALGFSGQLAVFDTRGANAPCYHCVFPDSGEEDAQRCAENGVFAPLVGVIGAQQAAAAMRVLLRGPGTDPRLWLFDALSGETRGVRLRRDPRCPVCASRPAA